MNLQSLKIFKLILFLSLFIFSVNFIIQGFSGLPKKNSKNINTSNKISFKKNNDFISSNNNNDLLAVEENNLTNRNLIEEVIIIKKDDTFSKILNLFFKNNQIKNSITTKLQKKFNLNNLNIGQKIYFYKNSNGFASKIVIPSSFDTDIIIDIKLENIEIKEEKTKINKDIYTLEFIISSSLYQDGIKAGIPIEILSDAIKLYSFDIDFQRDIKKNTKFEVSYEVLLNNKRQNIKYGNIKYVNLTFDQKKLEYYVFKTDEGVDDYFNSEGKNVKKSLLKTPINGARLSSTFGMRKHPISGYNKLHKGVDFAAPKGTPIYAGGNGVIEYAGTNGGYGKYIRIRHNNNYKTAYAHLSGFKKGIAIGKRVNQGDVIGFVGSTGNSTGPHLHYEIIFKNKQMNPMKLKLPSGKILKGAELIRFKKNLKEIYAKHLFGLYE